MRKALIPLLGIHKPSIKADVLFVVFRNPQGKPEAKDDKKGSQNKVLVLNFLQQYLGSISEIKHILLQSLRGEKKISLAVLVVLTWCALH